MERGQPCGENSCRTRDHRGAKHQCTGTGRTQASSNRNGQVFLGLMNRNSSVRPECLRVADGRTTSEKDFRERSSSGVNSAFDPTIGNEIPSEIDMPVVPVAIDQDAVRILVSMYLTILVANIDDSSGQHRSEIPGKTPDADTPGRSSKFPEAYDRGDKTDHGADKRQVDVLYCVKIKPRIKHPLRQQQSAYVNPLKYAYSEQPDSNPPNMDGANTHDVKSFQSLPTLRA